MCFLTLISIPETIANSNSKVFVTSSPATILEGFAVIIFVVVDSKSKLLLVINYDWFNVSTMINY